MITNQTSNEGVYNQLRLQVLEDIITSVSEDDDTYDYVFEKYLELKYNINKE